MQERDKFKDWLKDNLEEETRAVHFSPEARAAVKAEIITKAKADTNAYIKKKVNTNTSVNIKANTKTNAYVLADSDDYTVTAASAKTPNATGPSRHRERNVSWWDRRIALPRGAFAACIALLLLITGIYTRTFFYVTPQEIADYQADRQIIVPRDNTPFGALQMAVVQLPDKGVGRK